MTGHRTVYVTVPDRETALAIARAIVGERLAACANLLGEIQSVFWWDGSVREEGEVALIAKTTEEQAPALIARIRALHPYAVPCVVTWPIAEACQPYLDWISASVQP